MKILVINFEYPPLGGGGGVATKQLCEELVKRHEVHILTTAFRNLPREQSEQRVRVHRVSTIGRRELTTATVLSMVFFCFPAVLLGWKLCRLHKYDVICAQFVVPSGVPALILSWFFKIPLVVTFIGGDVYDPSKRISPHHYFVLRWLIRRIAASASALTAISHDTKERAEKLHGVKGKIKVIPIGFSPRVVAKSTRQELGLPASAFVFISVGRLIPRKGYKKLLNVWPDIQDAHLVIVGDGPQASELKQMTTDLNISDRVHLLGHVSEVKKIQLLHTSDAYISAASHEGFGIVFLEAMACGLPIIAPAVGGQIDFLESQQHALLVDADDTPTLKRAITTLMIDQDLRQRMGQNNLAKVAEFSVPSTTAQFERVLIHAKRGPKI